MEIKVKEHLNWSLLVLKTYLLMIATMFLTRIYFIVENRQYIKESIPLKVYLEGFHIGWIYDNAITSYILILFILFYPLYLIFYVLKYNKIGRIIWIIPVALLMFLVYAMNILNVEYFKEFGFHLNSSILDYSIGSTEIVGSFFSKEYNPILNIILIILAITVNVYFINRFIKRYEENKNPEKAKKTKWIIAGTDTVLVFVFLTLLVFGTRGGFGSSTLNWGKAYFSKYNFANQMALNGTFSFGKSYYYKAKKEKRGSIKKEYSLEESGKKVREMLNISDKDREKANNPLLREVITGKEEKKLNVVVVLLESWSGYGIKSIGGEKELTPYFDELSKEGILFTDFYASGGRSNRGVASVNVSYPSPLDSSITKDVISSQKKFLSIANVLKDRGYNTHFIYGGDAHFDNMDGFLRYNGIDTINGVHEFENKDRTIQWGVPDDKMFEFGLEYMKNLKEPFFVNYFTLSNHPPFDVDPEFKYEDKYNDEDMYNRDRAYNFSDYALGMFIEKVRKEEYAQNTVFAFVADHGINLSKYKNNELIFFHIPLLLWSPNKELLEPKKVDKVGSQVDILPTIMGVLGGNYLSGSWGQDLNQENKTNYAVISNGDAYRIVDEDYYYYESTMEGKKLFSRKTSEEIKDPDIMKKYHEELNAHIDLLNYQREQGIFGNE